MVGPRRSSGPAGLCLRARSHRVCGQVAVLRLPGLFHGPSRVRTFLHTCCRGGVRLGQDAGRGASHPAVHPRR